MHNRRDLFEKFCLREFDYLSEFGFRLIESKKDNYGCFLTYKNTWVAIKIALVGSGIDVNFYRLRDGQIPPYPIFFDPKEDFLVFNAVDLLGVKTGKGFDQTPARLYEKDYLECAVGTFAQLLHEHARDVLCGDFGVLPMIKDRVVKRARELENKR